MLEAARRLQRIIDNVDDLDGIIVGAAKGAKVSQVDKTLEKLHNSGARAEVITVEVTPP
ncbi:hypothetical protein CLV92_108133 [Kineococcus xinjiangensis]|uniref:Uncharacterized protein n=1 Tax=Kineococcus xinjiangensis TaxID=512762 RepID=A0A2S6IJ64_9ACTN|nr:hypothetical protein [Kineococcus xinjiangensis]PPK94231.1 hypothetical protein CLV92_108133 [Kineococcus xinjiangensis]